MCCIYQCLVLVVFASSFSHEVVQFGLTVALRGLSQLSAFEHEANLPSREFEIDRRTWLSEFKISMEKNDLDKLDLVNDIHTQNFNVIRLASYRTAVKFRFIQRRTHCNI